VERNRSIDFENQLRAVIETVVDGIITINAGGIIASFNPAAERIFGYRADEIIGQNISVLTPEPHRSNHDEYLAHYLTTGERKIIGIGREVEGVRKDGSRFPLDLSVSEMMVGGLRMFTGIIRDISERKAAEEALREHRDRLEELVEERTDALQQSRAYLQHLLDASPTVIYSLASDGVAQQGKWVGANIQRLLGYTVDEALAPGWWADHLHPDDREAALAWVARLWEDGALQHEYRFRHRDGSYRWLHDELVVNHDADGGPAELIGSWHDITTRKEAEVAVRTSNRALRDRTSRLRILNAIASAELEDTPPEVLLPDTVARVAARFPGLRVAYCTLDGDDVLQVRYAACEGEIAAPGERFCEVQLAPEHVRTLQADEVLVVPDVAADSDLARVVAPRGASPEASPDACQPAWATRALVGVPLGEDVSALGLLCLSAPEPRPWSDHEVETLVDVALALDNALRKDALDQARRDAEQRLIQSQRMEAIGRLAGGVAHDFNNLLTVINSYARFIIEELKEGDPIRADAGAIEQAGNRAAALTRQLLAFSRKQVLQPEVLSLNEIVTGLEGMLRRVLREDIDLVVSLAAEPGRVKADPGQLEQVLMNLVVNARDAMPLGGALTIETLGVHLDEEYAATHGTAKAGPHVLLSVSDNGMGMDKETRERIFEPFFTTKAQGEGTGLGLATVYGIVKQSGGNIWVYSEVGRGTTFKIYLPRVDAPATQPRRPKTSRVRISGAETVLLVEDEDGVREVTRRILAAAGYTVVTAASGPEALAICEGDPRKIHLVLTDVVMPQMSGRVFAERLASLMPGIKVVYMSGYTDNAIVHHGVLDEGMEFIAKPFNAADLTQKVREVLDAEEDPGSE